MYKILALNCLVSAYSLSVLYLDGVKLGDSQATVSGMLIAFCFLFVSRAQVRRLSAKRASINDTFAAITYIVKTETRPKHILSIRFLFHHWAICSPPFNTNIYSQPLQAKLAHRLRQAGPRFRGTSSPPQHALPICN
jgi:hypothetical protein